MGLAADSMLGLAMRFVVTIDNGAYDLGSWGKADGLEVSWDLVEYRAGDGKNERWYFPGLTKYSTVRLTRAASKEGTDRVRDWLESNSFKVDYQIGAVALQDAKGDTVADWSLRNVMPTKWSISGFDASSSKLAYETLDLAHLGFLLNE